MELNETHVYTCVHYLRQSICLKNQRERERDNRYHKYQQDKRVD